MALFEINPSGHWSTHSPPNNERFDAQVKQFDANVFLLLKKKMEEIKKETKKEEEEKKKLQVQVKQVDGQEWQINDESE